MSNAPVWGLVFYVNPPVLPPIAPGRGVVGQYIDRCISQLSVRPSLIEHYAKPSLVAISSSRLGKAGY